MRSFSLSVTYLRRTCRILKPKVRSIMKNLSAPDSIVVSVVIPAFNEEPTVGQVVERACKVLEELALPSEVIVVDDGSTDNTAVVAEYHGATVISNNHRLGKGSALRRGFNVCRGSVIVTLDADGSHRPEEIPKVLKPILNGGLDAVFGYRFHNPLVFPIPKYRVMGNLLFSHLIGLFIGRRIVDSQCGFRSFRSSKLKELNLSSRWFEIESEMLIKVIKKRLRYIEIPVTFEKPSTPSKLNSIKDGFTILCRILASVINL